MPMRLRFSLQGNKHSKILHLIAVDQAKRRDARPAELLGIYNRFPSAADGKKTLEWSADRIRYWLEVGAVPTRPVAKLLEMGGILKPGHAYGPKVQSPPATTTSA